MNGRHAFNIIYKKFSLLPGPRIRSFTEYIRYLVTSILRAKNFVGEKALLLAVA
jgi:hypothetical protein